jgi:acyl-CoA dehydrogenase
LSEATLERLRAEARTLGEREGAALHEPGLDEDAAARRAIELLAGAGLLGWTVPAAHGGCAAGALAQSADVSVRALSAIRDELAYHSGMLDVMFVMQGLGSYPVACARSPLADDVLPRVASGESIAAFALTEPGAGSDLGRIATRATRDGDAWVLEGKKAFISNAGLAAFYTVLARTAGEPGDGTRRALTMFLVPAGAPGVSVERFEVMAPHPIGDVVLDGVRVSADHLLGEEGRGLAVALSTLGRFRASVAAAANGFARRALDEARDHLRERVQFGEPLATKQGLQFDLADMDVGLRAAQLLVDEAAGRVDAGGDATWPVARAKLFATENASRVCDRAVQLLGGLGVKRGTVVERLFRDTRALRIYEGTSEVQKLLIAHCMLDRGN